MQSIRRLYNYISLTSISKHDSVTHNNKFYIFQRFKWVISSLKNQLMNDYNSIRLGVRKFLTYALCRLVVSKYFFSWSARRRRLSFLHAVIISSYSPRSVSKSIYWQYFSTHAVYISYFHAWLLFPLCRKCCRCLHVCSMSSIYLSGVRIRV